MIAFNWLISWGMATTTGTLPTMVTCLGQTHQFMKQLYDIRARRQASIQIVNQRLVESAVVHAVNCCLSLRGFSHQYGNCLTRVVSCAAPVLLHSVASSALFLCLLQCPCLLKVYYYDYLEITNEGFVAYRHMFTMLYFTYNDQQKIICFQ